MIADKTTHSRILWAKLGNDVAKELQQNYTVQAVDSESFKTKLVSAKQNSHPFFVYPGIGNIDVCYHAPKVTLVK